MGKNNKIIKKLKVCALCTNFFDVIISKNTCFYACFVV